MIELDGVQYELNSADENATDMVSFINQYCTDNLITNTRGELVQIEPNKGNPLYMLLYGLGYLVSKVQKLLYSAGCAFSIANSSVKQLEELCSIKGIHRKSQGHTSVRALIRATGQADTYSVLANSIIADTYTEVINPTGNPQEQGWYVLVEGNYVLTTDTSVQEGTIYYEKGNPQAQGLYVLVGGNYVLTTDTSVQVDTTYYLRTTEASPLVITKDMPVTINYNGKSYVFYPSEDITIARNSAGVVTFVSEIPCSLQLSENYFTSFDNTPANFSYMNTEASIPGQAEETDEELRKRLSDSMTASSGIDKAIQAIRNLPGVTLCNIYYNPATALASFKFTPVEDPTGKNPKEEGWYVQDSNYEYVLTDDTSPVPDTTYYIRTTEVKGEIKLTSNVLSSSGEYIARTITVPPRKACVIVQGYNTEIAKTFYQHMFCLTTDEVSTGSQQQDSLAYTQQEYVTKAGQVFPVYIYPVAQRAVTVNVYTYKRTDESMNERIRIGVFNLSLALQAGSYVSSAQVLQSILSYDSTLPISGVMLADIPYGDPLPEDLVDLITPQSDEVIIFSSQAIHIGVNGDDS